MAELPVFASYQPTIDDWRGLIVLSPDSNQEFLIYDSLRLERALQISAFSLHAVGVDVPMTSNNLFVNFYMSGEPAAEGAVSQSIASVWAASREISLPIGFAAMQLGRHMDIQLFGEEYLSSEACDVGQTAYNAYRSFNADLEALDQL